MCSLDVIFQVQHSYFYLKVFILILLSFGVIVLALNILIRKSSGASPPPPRALHHPHHISFSLVPQPWTFPAQWGCSVWTHGQMWEGAPCQWWSCPPTIHALWIVFCNYTKGCSLLAGQMLIQASSLARKFPWRRAELSRGWAPTLTKSGDPLCPPLLTSSQTKLFGGQPFFYSSP